MPKTLKKKFVTTQLVQQNVELASGHFVAKVIASRGNNLHEVLTAQEECFLVSMPTKFRHTLWVKRGNFVILRPIEEGDKVRAEIVHVLDVENIAFLMQKSQWPERFAEDAEHLTSRRKGGAAAAAARTKLAHGNGVGKEEELDDDDMYPPSEEEETEDEEEDLEECSGEEEELEEAEKKPDGK